MSAESEQEKLAGFIQETCPREITEGGAGTVAIKVIKKYRKALDDIMHELGVPQPGYPSPVVNAYEIARVALDDAWPTS